MKSDRESGIFVLVILAMSMLAGTLLLDPATPVSLKAWIESIFLFAFVLTTLTMIPYGYSCFVMVLHARKYRQQNEVPLSKESLDLPSVTVQLPIFNEKYVISRLIHAVGCQSYPAEKLQIQVLDDSTDDTTVLAEHEVTKLRDLGVNISLLHRTARVGFKAGALKAGLDVAVGDFIAIFDADFVPNPDFLRRAIQPLLRDAQIAWVQARWEHINRKYNWLTEALAFGIDGHFLVEQPCRQVENLTSNFCGTCGIIRRKAIESVGGWSEEVLTEDLYISYLLQLNGWRGSYLRDVAVPGEVPATVTALKYQQGRWCKGTVQVWKRVLVRVWKTRSFSLKKKLLATVHLTYYTVHPLLFIMLMVSGPLTISGAVLRHYGLGWQLLTILAFLSALATPLMYLEGARYRGLRIADRIRALVLLTIGGYGISISNSMNYIEGLRGDLGVFKRTPKYDLETRNDSWQEKRYQPSIPFSAPLEIIASAYSFLILVFAVKHFDLTAIPFLVFYAIGYLVVGVSTMAEALVRRRLKDKSD